MAGSQGKWGQLDVAIHTQQDSFVGNQTVINILPVYYQQHYHTAETLVRESLHKL